jgi:cysteinyl-tRNA synthetase
MGNLSEVARVFRVINIDADPGAGNFTAKEIERLKSNGKNRVISYLNVGSCERYRDYWKSAPRGYVACKDNHKAQRGVYRDYPDETWMDPSNEDYQRLLVEVVAPRLVAMGADGFFLDNLEILEHGESDREAPCDHACKQGGLGFVARLRAAFPDHLIVMQNATGATTRLGRVGGRVRFASLLDGIAREETYSPLVAKSIEAELLAWRAMKLFPGNRSFFIGTEDYVGNCRAGKTARAIQRLARSKGFCPYVTDASAGQKVICPWSVR